MRPLAPLPQRHPARAGAGSAPRAARSSLLLTPASRGASHGASHGDTALPSPEVPPGLLLRHLPCRSSAAAEARRWLPGRPPPAPASRPPLRSHPLFTLENLQGKDNNNPEETLSLFWPDKELR